MKIVAAKSILRANELLAEENRGKLDGAGVFALNLVGSPGAGKTTLIEAMIRHWGSALRPAVIEGDIAGSIDAERMERLGVPVVQINTEGACHLDANMMASALGAFDLSAIDLLIVENVGNLVCTAGFDLGEHARLLVLSTSEGDDKAVKYPAIFQGCDALVITKRDLIELVDFDPRRIRRDLERLNPRAEVFEVAARQGTGIPELCRWLGERVASRGA